MLEFVDIAVSRYQSLNWQLNKGDRHRIMKAGWSGSLWVTSRKRTNNYRILITGDLNKNLGAKIIYLHGQNDGEDLGRKYWYLNKQSDVETIISIYGNADKDKFVFDANVTSLLVQDSIPKPPGTIKPQQTISDSIQYLRDARVKAWVLKEAEGICELCRKPAPFITSNEEQFLEVHHLKRLAGGGSDTITNVVALCPNCHREMHYGERREEHLESFFSISNRLKRE